MTESRDAALADVRDHARFTRRFALRHLSLRERFNQQHDPEPMSGCWLWNGTLTDDGYGAIRNECIVYRAHRIAWTLFRGEIPDGLHVLHRCDVPVCVNPDHLFLGTDRDNVHDMISKGRANYPLPESALVCERRCRDGLGGPSPRAVATGVAPARGKEN